MTPLLVSFRDFQRAKSPVVPVIASIIVIDIRKPAVVGNAAVEAIAAAPKNLPDFIYLTANPLQDCLC